MSQKDKKDKKNSGLGLALWVVAAIVLFILILINWGKITSNLKETGFFGKVFGKTPEFIENTQVTEKPVEKNDVEPESTVEITLPGTGSDSQSYGGETDELPASETVEAESPAVQITEKEESSESKAEASETSKTETSKAETSAAKPAEKETAKTETKPASQTAVQKTMSLKLYFMEISSNGSVVRKEVTRTMPKSDSPLADAVNAIIKGPDANEESQGCRTMISNGTRLIGASVKNGVATLNFSSDFEINQFGIEGTRGQLQQIVYTATAFPTVDSVQFLVEGEKKEFLGQEGVWIGTPLSRSSFY